MPDPVDADLYQLIDDIPAMLAAFDSQGRSAYRNHACRAFFGLGDSGETGAENWISDLSCDDDPAIKSRIDRGSEVRLVRELTGIDGLRRFEVSLIPSVSPSGDVHGYVAIARDAADDEDTIASGDSVASLLDALPDGVLLFDAEGRLSHANSRFDVMWPTSERPFEPGADLDRTLQAVMQHACIEPCNADRTDDGAKPTANQGDAVTAVEMEVAGQTMLCRITGTASGGTMLTFNVIEKRLESGRTRHAMTDELIDAVARQMPGLIGQIDGDGRYVFANRAYSDWYGVPVDRIVGGTDEEMIAGVPRWRPDETWRRRRRANIESALSGQTVEFEEYRTYPDGHDRNIRGALIPSFDDGGGVRGVSIVTIDISEEKRREKALSESEERYRSLVELSPNYIMVHRDGECLFANPATNAIYGLERGDSIVGRKTMDLVHPDSRGAVIDRFKTLMSGEGPLDRAEIKIRRIDGSEIYLENRVASIHWDGEPAFLVVGGDISDRKRADQQIRDREMMFRGLVDALFDAVVISDQEKIIDFNSKALDLFGYDETEFGGLDILTLVPDDLHEFVVRQIEMEVSDPYELMIRTKDGRRFPVEISARTFVQNQRRVRVVAIRDLTQPKQAEDALRKSEELLRLVVDNLPAFISYIGADGRYKLVNASYEARYGVSHDQIVGRHFDELGVGSPDDKRNPEWRESRRRNVALALSGQSIEFERERMFADGQPRLLKGSMVPHLGQGGEVLGICVLSQDVSEQKKIEEAVALV